MTKFPDLTVAIASGTDRYPEKAPFDPPERYPELPFPDRPLDYTNGVYRMVRESLQLLGMDRGRFGRADWNPLGEIVSPGDRVLIKPNFVLHRNAGRGPLESVVTHASILRALADYILIALKGKGSLIIGDAPQMNCDLRTLFSRNGMAGLAGFLSEVCTAKHVCFLIRDFREEQTFYRAGIVWRRKSLGRSARDSVSVVLGRESLMDTVDNSLLYGADYDRRQTAQAHQNHRHEYRIAAEVLASDVIISVPKLKVHSKVGTTLNIKNMVGINTDKNHLAHYRIGTSARGGDEFSNPQWYDKLDRMFSDLLVGRSWKWGKYPFLVWKILHRAFRMMQPPTKESFTFGNWHGNDTAWRMALDLNRILLTADEQGRIIGSTPLRKYFSLIDGVVGGQGDGPLHPDAFPSHVVIAGFNPASVDWVATALMGFEPSCIPMYVNAVQQMRDWVTDFEPDRVRVNSNVPDYEAVTGDKLVFQFASAPGWRGKIERCKLDPPVRGCMGAKDSVLQQ